MSSYANESVVIKKYANRRLYNTSTSTYVTLGNLAEMVKEGTEFNVYDAKSNEDITRSVLAQIIVEEEGKTGQNLLPISFLRRLIGFYGDSMQWLVPKYLEHSLQSLTKNQEQIRDYFQKSFGNVFPFNNTIEQMSKQNLAMFENTMQMFSPFGMMGFATDKKDNQTHTTSSCTIAIKPVDQVDQVDSSEDNVTACNRSKSNKDPDTTATSKKKLTAVPTTETSKAAAAQKAQSGDDVQSKIAALQRQLSELARNKA